MTLDAADVDAVLTHMSADHAADSLSIVRAHGYPAATSAEMTGVDEHGGTWHVVDAIGEASVRITWPGGPVADRAGVRAAVVGLLRGGPAKRAQSHQSVEPQKE